MYIAAVEITPFQQSIEWVSLCGLSKSFILGGKGQRNLRPRYLHSHTQTHTPEPREYIYSVWCWSIVCRELTLTRWRRRCELVLSPVLLSVDGAETPGWICRGTPRAASTRRRCSTTAAVVVGSPVRRANSSVGTRKAGITEASANSCPLNPGSATVFALGLTRLLISLLQQIIYNIFTSGYFIV